MVEIVRGTRYPLLLCLLELLAVLLSHFVRDGFVAITYFLRVVKFTLIPGGSHILPNAMRLLLLLRVLVVARLRAVITRYFENNK